MTTQGEATNLLPFVSFCGFLPPEMYYDRATFNEQGEVEPDNGFVYKTDCWNVPYGKLMQLPKP